MVKAGRNVVLARDLTDAMYNPRRRPFVSHRRGTELVIEHVERHVCPSVLSGDLTGAVRKPNVVFVIGEDEYKTDQTLPAFAKKELEVQGIRCAFVHAGPKAKNDFRGLEKALKDADLVVLSVRRRTPAKEQLAALREYLESGRPLVAIRTSSHAFDAKAPEGHAAWPKFDVEVLGGNYRNHYGAPRSGPASLFKPSASKHPILTGIGPAEVESASSLYRSRDLAPTTTVLMTGRLASGPATEPVAWTNTSKGGRIFYTSLGGPGDFKLPAFRRLLRNAIFWGLDRQVPEK
jgi:type 1 glutamine amidotransferase